MAAHRRTSSEMCIPLSIVLLQSGFWQTNKFLRSLQSIGFGGNMHSQSLNPRSLARLAFALAMACSASSILWASASLSAPFGNRPHADFKSSIPDFAATAHVPASVGSMLMKISSNEPPESAQFSRIPWRKNLWVKGKTLLTFLSRWRGLFLVVLRNSPRNALRLWTMLSMLATICPPLRTNR